MAVEPTAIQLTWVGLGRGPVAVTVQAEGGERRRSTHDSDGGPGGVVLDGLRPATAHTVEVDGPEVPDARRRSRVRTPPSPPGAELFRLATISDVHLGARHFGHSRTMRERGQVAEPHPERCGRAAIEAARSWGAEMLLVKGDLVEEGHTEQWEAADRLLAGADMPVAAIPGNHEVRKRRPMDHPDAMVDGDVEIVRHVRHHDVPGARVVLANTSIVDRGHGAVRHLVDDVVERAAETDLPVVLVMHHYAQRFQVPVFWPPGIPGREGRHLLDALARANPRALVTSGHTHRNRTRRHGPLVVTEVGSTKDFPGVWGGYTVHEGGVVQTVRRTLQPEAMRWTEYTRRGVGGAWGRWAMGSLDDRSISHTWPAPA